MESDKAIDKVIDEPNRPGEEVIYETNKVTNEINKSTDTVIDSACKVTNITSNEINKSTDTVIDSTCKVTVTAINETKEVTKKKIISPTDEVVAMLRQKIGNNNRLVVSEQQKAAMEYNRWLNLHRYEDPFDYMFDYSDELSSSHEED